MYRGRGNHAPHIEIIIGAYCIDCALMDLDIECMSRVRSAQQGHEDIHQGLIAYRQFSSDNEVMLLVRMHEEEISLCKH